MQIVKHSKEGEGKETEQEEDGANGPLRGNQSMHTQVRNTQGIPRVSSLTGF